VHTIIWEADDWRWSNPVRVTLKDNVARQALEEVLGQKRFSAELAHASSCTAAGTWRLVCPVSFL
jgi:hypothetical protein